MTAVPGFEQDRGDRLAAVPGVVYDEITAS